MLRIRFLNVGNGDCTIIELPDGNTMVVDICNGNGSNTRLDNPIAHLSRASSIFRYVQTHPDMDHMDGLDALRRKLTITNFWDTRNTKPKPDFTGPFAKGNPEDWRAYQELRQNAKFNMRDLQPITLQSGGELPYNLYVLHPTSAFADDANNQADWNLISYVILMQFRRFKLLLGGDASDSAWEDILKWAQQNSAARSLLANVHVFKVSHHGRWSSYCGADMLKLTNPRHIVISKGTVPGEQSAYGSYYNKVGSERLWRTSQGRVVLTFDEAYSKATIQQASSIEAIAV